MQYPIDYRIGVSYLPETVDMGNDDFARTVMCTMDANQSFQYEIFYAAMLLAAERMTTVELLEFLIMVGRRRDVVMARACGK